MNSFLFSMTNALIDTLNYVTSSLLHAYVKKKKKENTTYSGCYAKTMVLVKYESMKKKLHKFYTEEPAYTLP